MNFHNPVYLSNIARQCAACDKSDPFVYARTMTTLRRLSRIGDFEEIIAMQKDAERRLEHEKNERKAAQ